MSEQAAPELKRILGRGDLMSIAIGQIIGAGIMALTGSAIGMTGKSIPLAFMLSALIVLLTSIPLVLAGGTIRMHGGQYTLIALLAGKRFAGMYVILFIFAYMTLAMYALSFADYFSAVIPGFSHQVIALTCLTVFYALNIIGIKETAKVQNLMVMLMFAALLSYCGYGFTKVQSVSFSLADPDFLTGGIGGLLSAAVLLRFATGGAFVVAYFGSEAKNPTRDVPWVIIVSTLGIAALYALLSVVASNILPLAQVANKPLTVVAKEIFPAPIYLFFVMGGAWFALMTTLNATFAWITKPLIQACKDGWLPRGLGAINAKYQTPHVLLTIFYAIGVITIIGGFDIASIALYAIVLIGLYNLILSCAVMRMPTVIPEIWKKSKYHTSTSSLITLCAISALVNAFTSYMSLSRFFGNTKALIGIGAIIIFAVAFAIIRDKTGKVEIGISYEEV